MLLQRAGGPQELGRWIKAAAKRSAGRPRGARYGEIDEQLIFRANELILLHLHRPPHKDAQPLRPAAALTRAIDDMAQFTGLKTKEDNKQASDRLLERMGRSKTAILKRLQSRLRLHHGPYWRLPIAQPYSTKPPAWGVRKAKPPRQN
jgi:hypothetical protein